MFPYCLFVCHQEQPYVMMKTKTNSSFALEGFCIDLLDAIANLVGFKYNISLVPDGKYGVYDYKTGEWNGMVRQLIDKVMIMIIIII